MCINAPLKIVPNKICHLILFLLQFLLFDLQKEQTESSEIPGCEGHNVDVIFWVHCDGTQLFYLPPKAWNILDRVQHPNFRSPFAAVDWMHNICKRDFLLFV